MIGRTSGACRFHVYKFSEVLGYLCMQKFVSKRDDFAVDVFFILVPLQIFEYRGDMFSFGVPVTEQAREFCSNWRRDICLCAKFR